MRLRLIENSNYMFRKITKKQSTFARESGAIIVGGGQFDNGR